MTPLKETLEAVESGAPQGGKPLKTDAGHLRADAVSLDVPVKIHGSRVTEVVLGVTPHTEPFEEQTSTMIVFPQGGVLRMSTVVSVGQVVVLTNLRSGKDAICRVAKVRACANNQNYVEVEFTHRQPGYWGVHFSSDGPELAKKAAPLEKEAAPVPAPRVSVIRSAEPNVISSSVKPANVPLQSPVQQGPPESSFISIGSQEKVQPAASSTTGAKGGDPFAISDAERNLHAGSKKSSVASFPAPSAPVASPFRTVAELRRDVQAASSASSLGSSLGAQVPELSVGELDAAPQDAAEPSAGHPRSAFDNFASRAAGGATRSAPREIFGAQLESESLRAGDEAGGPRKNWILIAACAAAALVVVGGGAFYLHGAHSPASAATSNSASASSEVSDASANSVSQPAQQANMVNSARTTVIPSTREVVVVHADPPPAKSIKSPPEAPVEPSEPSAPSAAVAPAKPQGSHPVSNLFGALNAHPAPASRASANSAPDVAPSVDLGGTPGADSSALGGTSPIASALPKPVGDGPLEVGGNVMAPRVISSAPPVYPAIALQTRVEGTVVIEAVVDKSGNVASAKVVSGPQLLRENALDALRRWKYQPSVLNGQPISVRMTVAIQFRR